ncbi:MAG: hypothetical protein ACP5HK_03285 [Acidilobus sp.]
MSWLEVRPAVILASSRCLAVSAALEKAPFGPDERVRSRLSALYSSLEPLVPDPSWGWQLAALWYATVYGGLVLVHRCEPVTPISRAHVGVGLAFSEGGARRELEDADILRAWAFVWKGMEGEGLDLISGETVLPEGLFWSTGGQYRIAVRGIVY